MNFAAHGVQIDFTDWTLSEDIMSNPWLVGDV
jgi:hypothetical protein